MQRTTLVLVTLGNELRGDDGAGNLFGRLIGNHVSLTVIEGGDAPENITGLVVRACPDTVVIVDALDFGGVPGEITVVTGEKLEASGISTHGSLKMFVDYIREMTGARVLVLGIQPKNLGLETEISPEVRASVESLAETCRESGIDYIFSIPELR
ncbi:hydrogenase 3 maturation endopeptidase HyCI [bacterium]|nr:hydrogenase 3 maturation endopeptidase HyCI [bacterium]